MCLLRHTLKHDVCLSRSDASRTRILEVVTRFGVTVIEMCVATYLVPCGSRNALQCAFTPLPSRGKGMVATDSDR